MPIQSSNPYELVTIDQWRGLNNQAARQAIDDQEMWWSENFLSIGPGNLRTLWGLSSALWTPSGGQTIIGLECYSSPALSPAAIAFLSDGSAYQIDLTFGTVNTVASAGTFTTSGTNLPNIRVKRWDSAPSPAHLLITSSDGYFAFDGTFYKAGDASPSWLNGGTPTTMPNLGSSRMGEVFQERVWLIQDSEFLFSVAENGADFASADGGGAVPYNGDQLREAWTEFLQSSGFLYLFGDSSVNAINNIQVNSETNATTFTNQNVDPQVGGINNSRVQAWNRAFVMVNPCGFWAIYGGAAQKISDKIQNLVATGDFDGVDLIPSAMATIYGVKCYLCLLTATDVFGVTRPMLFLWDGQKWSIASQEKTLTNISSAEINSQFFAYGTDGTSIYQLFSQPSVTLQKRISTKTLRGRNLMAIKNWRYVFGELQDNSGQGARITGSMTTGGGEVPGGALAVTIEVPQNAFDIVQGLGAGSTGAGLWAELDLTSVSPDFTLERLSLAYDERTLFGA